MTTLFSALGGTIFVDGYDGERKVTLLADGTAKAGWLVGQAAGDGIARGVNPTGNLDEFDGIQAKRYDTDIDTAPTAGLAVDVYYPISGHRYRIRIKDPGGAAYVGEPMIFIAGTAGALDKAGDIEAVHQARLSKDIANLDTFAEVVWGQ